MKEHHPIVGLHISKSEPARIILIVIILLFFIVLYVGLNPFIKANAPSLVLRKLRMGCSETCNSGLLAIPFQREDNY